MHPTSGIVALAVTVAIPVEAKDLGLALEDILHCWPFDFELMLDFGHVWFHPFLDLHP